MILTLLQCLLRRNLESPLIPGVVGGISYYRTFSGACTPGTGEPAMRRVPIFLSAAAVIAVASFLSSAARAEAEPAAKAYEPLIIRCERNSVANPEFLPVTLARSVSYVVGEQCIVFEGQAGDVGTPSSIWR